MPDEINFTDAACLLRLTPEMTLERLGTAINASMFDAANLAGSMKQKGIIEFTSYYPGPNTIAITDTGKAFLKEADEKSVSPFDKLDEMVLTQIATGKRHPSEVQSSMNINSKDLALRLYKLNKQGLLTYDLKSGRVELLLTETGFLKTDTQQVHSNIQSAQPKPSTQQPQPAAAPQQGAPTKEQVAQQAADPQQALDPSQVKLHGKPLGMKLYIAIAIVVVVILAILYFLLR